MCMSFRKFIFICSLLLFPLAIFSQQMGTAVSTFLEFPISAHTAALGGNPVSFMGTDNNFAFSNPSLLSTDAYNRVSLNYSVYMSQTGYGSASYTTKFSDKDAFMVGFQGAFYGTMDGYDASGNKTGNVSANDFALSLTYSRYINKYFSVGATLKPVLNCYADYTSFSLGADIGATFHDSASMVNLALVVQNFGGRLVSPTDVTLASEWMPINVVIGLSKRLKKAPLVFHLTLQNLQKWNYNYQTYNIEGNDGKESVGMMIGRKFIIGMDVMPVSEKYWVSLSYNFDRGLTLSNPVVLSVAGLSLGVGAKLYMFQLGVGVAFYSSAAITGHFSLAMDINWFKNNNNKKKL